MPSSQNKLIQLLNKRKDKGLYRSLSLASDSLTDFYSNDYLGFSTLDILSNDLSDDYYQKRCGSTGSRLLSGNSEKIENLEKKIADFHVAESSLIFNSGYDANLGFFSCVPQKNDLIFYDELSHASIIDGIRIGIAKSVKFRHNNLEDLIKKISLQDTKNKTVFVVVESIYSMNGDFAPLASLAELCEKNGYNLVVDEAHAGGIFGDKGNGLCITENIHHKVFARIITFGKAFGCHGAAVCGSNVLREFLINFSRPFIYTTALPSHTVDMIDMAYKEMKKSASVQRDSLFKNIDLFRNLFHSFPNYLQSKSPIQSIIIPGNNKVNYASAFLTEKGFDVRAIKSPTVEQGKERLRICLHSFNTSKEINNLFLALSDWEREIS